MAKRICSVAGCDRTHYARGICRMHYSRYRAGTLPADREDWIDRFLRYVDDSDPDGCWPWIGPRHNAYGVLQIDYQFWLAHRLSFALHTGNLPDGAFICHHCDNPPCVQPLHLYAGDSATNVADMMSRGRGVAPAGEQNGFSRITSEQVIAIRADWETGRYTQTELGRTYGVPQAHVSRIVLRRVWNHV